MNYRHHNLYFYKGFEQGKIANSTSYQTDEHILPRRYLAALKSLSSNDNIVILSSDKSGGGGGVMDSTVYHQKLLELLDYNNSYERISPKTI